MRTFWSVIEAAPPAAAEFAWRRWFRETFPAAAAVGLRKTDRRVKSLPCPNGCGYSRRVVGQSAGFVGVCDEADCEDLPLSIDDVMVWELDGGKLARAVRKAWGLNATDERLPVAGVTQVGLFAGTLTVTLTLNRERSEFRRAIAELAARLKGPFILLAPTAGFYDANTQELLGGVKAGFFDLESQLTLMPAGTLQARKSAGELFSAFLPEQRNQVSENEAIRVFALRKKLRTNSKPNQKAPLNDVFDLLVIEDRTQEFVAREYECSPGLISKRVDEIEAIMERDLGQLKALASRLNEMDVAEKDPRARKLYRKGLTDDTSD